MKDREELGYGDLVEVRGDGSRGSVYETDPYTKSEAIELIESGEMDEEDFVEGMVVDDELEGSVVIQSGPEKFAVPLEDLRLVRKKENRKTDVPAISENFRWDM